jgi:hypothetical protein
MRPTLRILVAALAVASLSCDRPPTSVQMQQVAELPTDILDPSVALTGALDAGNYNGCAIATDGTIRCWGEDSWGNSPDLKTASASSFRQVSTGEHFASCALRWDGEVECFGQNTFGAAPATKSGVNGDFAQVSVGSLHACGLIVGGAFVECWGTNTSDQAPAARPAPGGTSYTSVDASYGNFTCATRADGKVDCWGTPPFNATFQQVGRVFKTVTVGADFMCALRGDGRAKCYGDNAYGQAPALRQPAVGTFKQIAAGGHHACGVRTDGIVECWGDNANGQAPATRTASQGTFVRVVAGKDHSCGFTTSKIIECWGDNTFHQAEPPFLLKFRFNGLSGLWKTANYPAYNQLKYDGNHVRRTRIQFSLGSNEGLNVFAPGYPKWEGMYCPEPGPKEGTMDADGELTYDATKNRYTYEWVMQPWYTGCFQFIAKFTDGTVARANFDFNGTPTSITVFSGNNQAKPAGDGVGGLSIRVLDTFGNGVRNQTVSLAVVEGGGSVDQSTVVSGESGILDLPVWNLGKSAVPQRLRLTLGSLTTDITATITTNFNIDVRFFGPEMSNEHKALFTSAAARLRGLIVDDVANVVASNLDIDACLGTNVDPLNETIDDIVIYASVASIDGPGSVLASAGPCFVRNSNKLPVLGRMRFDIDDLEDLAGDGSLEDVILHEMLHVLGIGTIWGPSLKNLISGSGTADPRYIGEIGIAACQAVGGTVTCATDVPLENTGGAGTAEGHWRETTFDTELMTGYAESVAMPLSLLTLGGLWDLGYGVNANATDNYGIPGGFLRRGPARPKRGWDKPLTDHIVVIP